MMFFYKLTPRNGFPIEGHLRAGNYLTAINKVKRYMRDCNLYWNAWEVRTVHTPTSSDLAQATLFDIQRERRN